jgi:hypothetical protein
MRKFFKLVIGILLLPLCLGSAAAVWRMLRLSGSSDSVWMPLLGGALCWTVVYLLLPRPMWISVAVHHLPHALWAGVLGGGVGGIRVSSRGGHVEVSKSNFVIALAPYFFPFYAVLVVLCFLALRAMIPWNSLEVWFLLLLGAAYGFHLTLTLHVLKTRQSDISDHGRVFSAAIILLGNTLVLVLAIPLLMRSPTLGEGLKWCWEETWALVRSTLHWVR